MKGQLWIVAAPSGGGKTSLIAAVKKALPHVVESISHTTRERREGEIEGVHYFFVSQAHFDELREKDDFLEYAQVFHHAYGTSGARVQELLDKGNDVILSIDWQGADQVRARRPDVKSVFLLPPSLDTLRERLMRRGQDHLDVVEKRMSEAEEQISHYKDFDYVIVNDVFDKALEELKALIISSRLKRERCVADLAPLLKQLGQEVSE